MSIQDALRVAVRAIVANGLRSILTTLGIAFTREREPQPRQSAACWRRCRHT